MRLKRSQRRDSITLLGGAAARVRRSPRRNIKFPPQARILGVKIG
jgi:hypothetical protein